MRALKIILTLVVGCSALLMAQTPADNPLVPYIPKNMKFLLVGPLTEESRIRGIAVIKADSLEEAQRIAAADPLVQAGRLTVEVHPIMLEDLSSIHFEYPVVK